MPVRPGQPMNPEATRARILDAGLRAFYERGVHAVGIAEIAEAAGASKLTIYRHFGSKEGLIDAVLRARSDRVHEWIEREVSAAEPGAPRILALFDLLAEWYREERFRGCGVANIVLDTRDGVVAREGARRHLDRYLALLSRCLDEARASNPAELARQLLVLIEGMTMVNVMSPDPRYAADTRTVAELLLTRELAHR